MKKTTTNKITYQYKLRQKMMETEEDDCGFFQLAKSAFLSRVVKGEIDLNTWAKLKLANRGLDKDGKWIGFDASRKLVG